MCSRSRGPSIGPRAERSARSPWKGGEEGEGADPEALDRVTWMTFRLLANVSSGYNKPRPRRGPRTAAKHEMLRHCNSLSSGFRSFAALNLMHDDRASGAMRAPTKSVVKLLDGLLGLSHM